MAASLRLARASPAVAAAQPAGELDADGPLAPRPGSAAAPCAGRPRAPDGRAASAARRRRCACRRHSGRQLGGEPGRCRRAKPKIAADAGPGRRRPAGARKAGSAISRPSAAASAAGSPGGTSRPVSPSTISSAMAPARVATHGKPLARRLHQHVGQAVAVAVAGDPAGQREQIGGAQGRQDLGLALRARARRCARRGRGSRPGPSASGSSGPPPIWTKRQARVRAAAAPAPPADRRSPSSPPRGRPRG